jgi:5-methyltetrahydrofolate--homocysteine methyltransferase
MNLSDFIKKNQRTVLIDGAMGTQLIETGLEMSGHNCLTNPDTVLAIHQKYSECDIDLITTNTLTMNRIFIESHKVNVDVREVNLAGVRLARKAAHTDQYVLGNLSSTGKLLKPTGNLLKEDAYKSFREQAFILLEGGVDGFIIETMIDLQEALLALRACRDAADIPAIITIAFNTVKNGGRTIMGNSAKECAKALADEGACAVGANCGSLDPFEMAEIVSEMRAVCSVPIVVQPNAGKPKIVDKKTVFNMTPSEFTSGIKQCIGAGAGLVGGCCGTTPAHICAVADLLGR